MGRVVDACRRAPVTALLLLACVAMFVLMCTQGGFEAGGPEFDDDTLIRFGALRPDKVWEGEFWRLLTAGLVHADPLHILFNGWALIALGPPLERRLSPLRALILVVGSQLGCTVTDVCFGTMAPLVGASGVACGLLGGLLVSALRRRDPLAMAERRLLLFWAFQVVVLSVIIPGVSLLAHLGGGVAGAALMVGLEPSTEHRANRIVSLGFACLLLGIGVRLAVYEPDRPNWNMVQGLARYDQHRYVEAIPFLRKAMDEGGGEFRPEVAHAILGDSLVEIGDRDAGLAELVEADSDGSSLAAHRLGELASNPHEAIARYARAMELDPKEAEHRQGLLRQVVILAASAQLPTPADLAPLVHLPDGPEFDAIRLIRAAAAAGAGDPKPLASLEASNPDGGLPAIASWADAGPADLPGLLREFLIKRPGLFQNLDGGVDRTTEPADGKPNEPT